MDGISRKVVGNLHRNHCCKEHAVQCHAAARTEGQMWTQQYQHVLGPEAEEICTVKSVQVASLAENEIRDEQSMY
jgi:hypothetical protein